jgi:hypothetical protein
MFGNVDIEINVISAVNVFLLTISEFKADGCIERP